MTLPIELEAFDVIVTLEVLSHVIDQQEFLQKLAGLLKPGGVLMLATQNRTVLQGHCILPPPGNGQIRKWVDRSELRILVDPYFEICDLFSITPIATKGLRRLLTASRLRAMQWPLIGRRLRILLEGRDWGWTLMLRAQKRPSDAQSYQAEDDECSDDGQVRSMPLPRRRD
jgi:SAM-dependent methyltransferase